MTTHETPETDHEQAAQTQAEELAASISGCFSNVSHLPEWMRVQALGRDTYPLLVLAADAVLRSDWLAARDAAVAAQAKAEAWDEGFRAGARGIPTDDYLAGVRATNPYRAVVSPPTEEKP